MSSSSDSYDYESPQISRNQSSASRNPSSIDDPDTLYFFSTKQQENDVISVKKECRTIESEIIFKNRHVAR